MFKQGLLEGRRTLVTGGGGRLGSATTEKFLELGADAVICARRGEVLAATAKAPDDRFRRKVATFSWISARLPPLRRWLTKFSPTAESPAWSITLPEISSAAPRS